MNLIESPGTGRLTFERVANRTAVVESFASSPLKFVIPQNHGSAAWAVCSTYGGGLLGGDAIEIKVRCGAETQAVLMTQASTKVYRSGQSARQTLDCDLKCGALLISAPDRVACFAGSSLNQTQRFTLEAGANLAVVDWLSAGRLDSGERWQFERYSSRIEIVRDGKALFRDTLLLDPAQGPLPERLRRFNTLATLVLGGPLFEAGAKRLLEDQASQPAAVNLKTRIAASPLGGDGVVLRCAGEDIEALGKFLRGALAFVCDIIGDDPWARRW